MHELKHTKMIISLLVHRNISAQGGISVQYNGVTIMMMVMFMVNLYQVVSSDGGVAWGQDYACMYTHQFTITCTVV